MSKTKKKNARFIISACWLRHRAAITVRCRNRTSSITLKWWNARLGIIMYTRISNFSTNPSRQAYVCRATIRDASNEAWIRPPNALVRATAGKTYNNIIQLLRVAHCVIEIIHDVFSRWKTMIIYILPRRICVRC